MNEPIHVSDEAFEKAVLKSPLPVLVDFWAPWCTPCRLIAPSLEKIAQEMAGTLIVAKVDTDKNANWAAHFGISGIPTILFISGGQVVRRQVGALSYKALRQAVDEFLASTRAAEKAAS